MYGQFTTKKFYRKIPDINLLSYYILNFFLKKEGNFVGWGMKKIRRGEIII